MYASNTNALVRPATQACPETPIGLRGIPTHHKLTVMKKTVLALALLALPLTSCSTGNSTESSAESINEVAVTACETLPTDVDLAIESIDIQGGLQGVITDHINSVLEGISETGNDELDQAISYARLNATSFTQEDATQALNDISTVCENVTAEAAVLEQEIAEAEIAALKGPLADAYRQCGAPRGASIEDDGRTLLVRTSGKQTARYATYSDVECLLNELDAPTRTFHRVESTRAVDGRGTDEWGQYTAEWSYDPRNGLNLIVYIGTGN